MGISSLKKIYLLSLGCPRNLTDSEVLLASLEKKGFQITEKAEEADVGIINTCGFIQDAKQESIEMILHLAELKKEGKLKKLVVCGCLSQRYPAELASEIKEIDGIFGTAEFGSMPDMIEEILAGKKVQKVADPPSSFSSSFHERKFLTPPHYVYVKIQEGCSNRCSYCVIPQIKGPHRSRTIDSVVKEVEKLKNEYDVKEIVLIGQDITSFGIERTGKGELIELIKKASQTMKDGWVRLLYAHPAHFTDELIDMIADRGNICKYIDLPIQHINDNILEAMNRRVTRSEIEKLIGKVRKKIKDVTIRTSVIVGFPGETEEEFDELLKFLKDTRFERLGAFVYSREEGSPAANFDGQVPEKLKKERFDKVMSLQQKISHENNLKWLNKEVKVLIDEKDPSGREHFIGRSQMEAPEVDGVIYVKGNAELYNFCNVRITGTLEYDLMGEVA